MPSLETLELISSIAWKIYGKANSFQGKFWLKKPINWDDKKKRASFRPVSKCIPLLIVSIFQVPTYLHTFWIMYRQGNPKTADPRFPLTGVVLMAFGAAMNFFITFGSFSNFFKRKEWALCLNVIAEDQFHKKTKTKKQMSTNWARVSLWHDLSISDLIANGVFFFLLFLAFSGFTLPLLMDVDPIAYIFIDIKHSREWYILKFGIRPVCFLIWSSYCTWTFYNITANIFFVILHGIAKIPRVPKNNRSQKLTVIPNSLSNLTFSQKLAIQLMEAAYKEYRQFQIFIRVGNDAGYLVIPDGIAGISCVSVIGGFATLKASHKFPIGVFALFPSVFTMCMSIIAFMIPIACNVFESALQFKRYWLSRFLRKEVKKRIKSLRPMGIAVGPFGYIQRSIPMQLTDAIVDFICSLCLSVAL